MSSVGSFRESVSGGAHVRVSGLTWRPARRRTPVLRELELSIAAGERLLVAGPSGSGKSTLLRAIAGQLQTADHGDLSGSVQIAGQEVRENPGRVGLLLQDPAAGVVAEAVGRDVAFGLENQGVPRQHIWPRVEGALRATDFPYGVDHPTSALSGGETQRLMLAGIHVLDTPVLLLDEPTSMLDPPAGDSVRRALQAAVRSRGCTTVVVEHHLEPWVDFVDRLVVLGAGGEVMADGSPSQVLARHGAALAAQGVWVPGLDPPELSPIDAELIRPWQSGPAELVSTHDVVVELPVALGNPRSPRRLALDRVDATVRAGRALAVTGASGAGKSTLVSVLAGLLRPTAGHVHSHPSLGTSRGTSPWRWRSRDLAARLSWVPQTPEHGVATRSVSDEVLASARACGRDVDVAHRRAHGLLEAFGLSHLTAASPYHLSNGEQRRLMVAAALAHGPFAVLLDEPTVGQDRRTWAAVLGAVSAARTAGCGVALATHDRRAVAAIAADQNLALAAGRVAV